MKTTIPITWAIPTACSGRCSTTGWTWRTSSRLHRRLPAGQPAVRAQAQADAARGRHRLDPRLPPDPVGGRTAGAGLQHRIGFFLHIPLPPPLILAAIPGHDWLIRGLCLRSGRLSKRGRPFALLQLHPDRGPRAEPGGRALACLRPQSGRRLPDRHRRGGVPALAEAPEGRTCTTDAARILRRKLLVGVDRLDYSKGLPQRMRAFRELLAEYPETHGARR